jgi:hypothetical protein
MHGAYHAVYRAWRDAELACSQATYRLAEAVRSCDKRSISRAARCAGDLHVEVKCWFRELLCEMRAARA